jgi:hypothetical protein
MDFIGNGINDEELPPGHVNMGDARNINWSKLMEDAGKTTPSTPNMSLAPVRWEERHISELITEYRPIIRVLNIAEFELDWRMQPLFFAGEMMAYKEVISNVINEYVWGVAPFLETQEKGGIKLTPNPDFIEFVKQNTLDGFKKTAAVAYQDTKELEDESLLPMQFNDPEGNTTGFLSCTKMVKSDARSFPVMLRLSYCDASGNITKEQDYAQLKELKELEEKQLT